MRLPYWPTARRVYRFDKVSARGLPVCFQEAPTLKKPRRKASRQEWAAWRQQRKLHNLSTYGVEARRGLRLALDAAGASAKRLLGVGDNSFCNRTLLRSERDRSQIIDGRLGNGMTHRLLIGPFHMERLLRDDALA
jgi:hypothetical protein